MFRVEYIPSSGKEWQKELSNLEFKSELEAINYLKNNHFCSSCSSKDNLYYGVCVEYDIIFPEHYTNFFQNHRNLQKRLYVFGEFLSKAVYQKFAIFCCKFLMSLSIPKNSILLYLYFVFYELFCSINYKLANNYE